MKIGYRLTLFYFGASMLILLLFSIITYFSMQRMLYNTLNNDMEIIFNVVERSYNSSSGSFGKLNQMGLEMNQNLNQIYLVVYDKLEFPVYSSVFAKKLTLKIAVPKEKEHVDHIFHLPPSRISGILSSNKTTGDQITFKGFSRKLYYNNEHIGWVTVALPIEGIKTSMTSLLKILITLSLIFTLLIALGSYFLTQKVLSPIKLITDTARKLSYGTLDKRISVPNNKDELAHLSLVLNDMLARLQKSFISQQHFILDAAHEIKTPLAILRTSWEDEFNDENLPVKVRIKLLQDIETITRLNQVINKLLLLSQTEAEAEEARSRFAIINVKDILQDVIGECKILARQKSQKLFPAHIKSSYVLGDQALLFQLFFNLIENAIKYTPNGGEIRLSFEQSENMVTILVKDNGVGISSTDLPFIFNRFYRVNKDRSRKTGGSGLGLAICSFIVELHNGNINAQSVINLGSTFTVSLPLTDLI